MAHPQRNICPGKWLKKTPMGFWHINRSSILGQTTRTYNNQQKQVCGGICRIVNFAVLAVHIIKIKESKKKDKYCDLNWELKKKKLWNIKVTITPIVIGALGTIPEILLKRLEDLELTGRGETIQTTALLRSARISRRVQETWWDLLSLKLQWKNFS